MPELIGVWTGVGIEIVLARDFTFMASGGAFEGEHGGTYSSAASSIVFSPNIDRVVAATYDHGRLLVQLRDIGVVICHREREPRSFPAEMLAGKAREPIRAAIDYAARCNHFFVESFHLLAGCLTVLAEEQSLNEPRFAIANLTDAICAAKPMGDETCYVGRVDSSDQCEEAIVMAANIAINKGLKLIPPQFIAAALLGQESREDIRFLEAIPLRLEAAMEFLNRAEPAKQELHHPEQDLPPQVQQVLDELDAQIENCNQRKEFAVIERDYAMAINLRTQVEELRKKKSQLIHESRRCGRGSTNAKP